MEAQVRVWQELIKIYPEQILFNIKGPSPPYENMPSSRVKLEWTFPDPDKKKVDIVVFCFERGDRQQRTYEDVELFVEIKVLWGEGSSRYLKWDAFKKDFELAQNHVNAYAMVFIGDCYGSYGDKEQESYRKFLHELKYKKVLGGIFLIFRDTIFTIPNGAFDESALL